MIRDIREIMGMPVSVEIVDESATLQDLEKVFSYLATIDAKFSPYKLDSELSRINRGEIEAGAYSAEMREVLRLSEQTKQDSQGYFDIKKFDGTLDPSGLVKGWAIFKAAKILSQAGWKNYFIEAGGDIQTSGRNSHGQKWSIGIRNPFQLAEIVKVVYLDSGGVATSGTYLRGEHIYNPLNPSAAISGIVSLTVIGPNVYEADRFATAAFAMGQAGIAFIERWPGLEGYLIDSQSQATMTSGFERYTNA